MKKWQVRHRLSAGSRIAVGDMLYYADGYLGKPHSQILKVTVTGTTGYGFKVRVEEILLSNQNQDNYELGQEFGVTYLRLYKHATKQK